MDEYLVNKTGWNSLNFFFQASPKLKTFSLVAWRETNAVIVLNEI